MALVLGIETSCDETAAAVVDDGTRVLSNVVATQIEIHRRYGGVFPEVASRQHVLSILPVIQTAMEEASVAWDDLGAIAVTHGPGLTGSLLVGVNVAKGLAWAKDLPLLGINHLEGHIYANWLGAGGQRGKAPASFPILCLVVSGGHTELVLMSDYGRYRLMGRTLDDAAGEAFDKVGRLLGLPYPGGPAIQEVACTGDPESYRLPRALLGEGHDFSFSGLKTAVLRETLKLGIGKAGVSNGSASGKDLGDSKPSQSESFAVSNLAASFQEAVVDALVSKTKSAVSGSGVRAVLLAGGVASNLLLRTRMAAALPVPVHFPEPEFCTDNAAMIASAGHFRFEAGHRSDWDLDVIPGLVLDDRR
jgi:N6-L-threonylcarbamoyladenine synthase